MLFFLLVKEDGVASDEGSWNEDFAGVALEVGVVYFGLGVEYLAA